MRGEYVNTVDEKGRVMIPAKFRSELGQGTLILVRQLSNCLWLMTEKEFENYSEKVRSTSSGALDINSLNVVRRIVNACQEVEMDKAGRICISAGFRKYAQLEPKGDCTLLGSGRYVEIWSTEHYDTVMNEIEPELEQYASVLAEYLRS